MPWPASLGIIAGMFLAVNLLFALGYLLTGGVEHARPGSLWDAFCFSVQTSATIGYGGMAPTSIPAHILVIVEAVVGLVLTALSTGLLFAKFGRTTARVVFSQQVALAPMDGTPTLMIRLGNERGNNLVEAIVRVTFSRTTRTAEGMLMYRMLDLPLVRERAPVLSRSWTSLHRVTPDSPLYNETPASLALSDAELLVTVWGTDDTSLQPVHAMHTYDHKDIAWGARHADILAERPDGGLIVDLHQFHLTVPTVPSAEFLYPPP
jgi:inward rectifier potassium channel